ncbi:MAG: peptidylprolyl isomerase [Candidatus Aminicenantes bacterium]|nr:peptidylprolyl isomerase [Candidatus Aminicenantes bacterium]
MLKKMLSLISILGLFIALSGLSPAKEDNPQVLIKTTKGDITIELYPDKAPISIKNFLSYVDEKFYDGTIFHRVIKGFMIQAGGMSEDLAEKPGKPMIKNEAKNGLSNKRGTIAMGRMQGINTISCHFYINHVDNPGLDYRDETPRGFGYPVFGKVTKGMDVVDAIANVKTMVKSGMPDVPRETVTIISIRRIDNN